MQKRALCIGINDYKGCGRDLVGCVNDAGDWGAVLEGRGYAVVRLLDGQATLAMIRTALASLVEGCVKGDQVVLTYSGFGSYGPPTDAIERLLRPVWCPWDVADGHALPLDEVADLLNARAKGVRAVVVSDTCHSATVTRGDDQSLDPGTARMRILPPFAWLKSSGGTSFGTSGHLDEKLQLGDVQITACPPYGFAWEGRFTVRPNGVFTYYALKTLAALPSSTSYDVWLRRITLPSARWTQRPCLLGKPAVRREAVFG